MQVIIHVLVNPTVQTSSLRKAVIDDLSRNSDHLLAIEYEKKRGRKNGWTKIKANGVNGVCGALNIKWDNHSKSLIGRAVTKGNNQPDMLLGLFVRYLLCEHADQINAIMIRPLPSET